MLLQQILIVLFFITSRRYAKTSGALHSPDLECAHDKNSFPNAKTGMLDYNFPKSVFVEIKHVTRTVRYEEAILHKVKDTVKVHEQVTRRIQVLLKEYHVAKLSLNYTRASDKYFFADVNPRHLRLMFANERLFVSIGLLLERMVHGVPSASWVCSNGEFDIYELNDKRIDFYYSRFGGVETYDFLRFEKLEKRVNHYFIWLYKGAVCP